MVQAPLPRIFGVFFNQNQSTLFAKREVRRALDLALNKERIVESILGGYGSVINSPLPPNVAKIRESEYSIEKATLILEDNGWKKNEDGIWEKKDTLLSFSLSTSNTTELKAVASIVEEEWENFGALVDLQIFEPGVLNQNVIRPRKYDALLFGEIVGRELDLYAFWHSSQMNDPGLNIALYANIAADRLLEDAREISDREERLKKYSLFEDEIYTDSPSVFLYSPDFIYIFDKKINGINVGSVTVPAERFLNVHNWYIETNQIWKLFNN
jgi:peptide/nickel transport system substrate-binding protein